MVGMSVGLAQGRAVSGATGKCHPIVFGSVSRQVATDVFSWRALTRQACQCTVLTVHMCLLVCPGARIVR